MLPESSEQIAQWNAQGVSGVVMHTVLVREHGFTGSYSAVRRMLADLRSRQAPARSWPTPRA